MTKPNDSASPEPRLTPMAEFEATVKKVLSASKTETDRRMAAFQAANKKRRDGRTK